MSESPSTSIQLADYGLWQSPLSPEDIFQTGESISFPRPLPDGEGIFYLLSIAQEGNVNALMHLSPQGRHSRITAEGVNVRSRVHEYGGIPYTATRNAVYYCNYADQRVYRQSFDAQSGQAGASEALTPLQEDAAAVLRYADFLVDPERARLICVREDYRADPAQPAAALVAIDLERGGEGEVLFGGSDFVAAPCLSADGRRLAFQTWSHPNMPWDDTQLRIADIAVDGKLNNLREVAKPAAGSLLQPRFNAQGDLFFIADWSDWWNLYRVPSAQLDGQCEAQAVCPLAAEFCSPQWQLGQQHYAFCNDEQLLVSINRNCFWELSLLDLASGQLKPLHSNLGVLEQVFCAAGKAFYYAASARAEGALHVLEPDTGRVRTLLTSQQGAELSAANVSLPEHFSYPAADGDGEAYGIFYPPRNAQWHAPEGSLPPLLVSVHGGPTSSAKTAFNPAVQFWTTRGFAVLDVNHRGSTGYGRRFRHTLYGRWGEADVADVISAVEQLIAQGRVAADKIMIRGGSAGGYVVLSVLAQSDLFSAGASYYGVSDLELLARDTHKFESRYLDQLIGPWPEAAALYRERSPIHRIKQIRAPVLLLQGMEDRVVPPNQAEIIFTRLHESSPQTRLLCFEDEGHGFRKPQNQIAALQAELEFYRQTVL